MVAMYNNKLIMRDSEIESAIQWIKARKDEQVLLANERHHLLSKTKLTPLDASPFFFEETEGQMFLKWHESAVLGPNISNHYLIEVAQYPCENWQSLGVIKKAPYNQIGLKDFYSLDPHLELQFRVKVINPHGISAASKCLITKGIHKKTRKQRIEEVRRLRQIILKGSSLPLPKEDKEMRIQENKGRHKGHWEIIQAANYPQWRIISALKTDFQ